MTSQKDNAQEVSNLFHPQIDLKSISIIDVYNAKKTINMRNLMQKPVSGYSTNGIRTPLTSTRPKLQWIQQNPCFR